MGGAVGCRFADVAPVRRRAPAVTRDALGDEAGKELALDRARAVERDALEQRGVDEIDPRVDRVGGDLLSGGRLLAKRTQPSVGSGLDQAILARVWYRLQIDGRA